MRMVCLWISLLCAAACARRFPGTADVPAATEYRTATGTAQMPQLAGRVKVSVTAASLVYDPGLDEVTKVVAADFGHRHELPGALYVQELLWRRGVTGRYAYFHAGWKGGKGGVAVLDAMLSNMLDEDKDLAAKTFGVTRTPLAVVMVLAEVFVDLQPLPAALAPSQPFVLAGKLRVPGATSLLAWGPGELEPRTLLLHEDGSWDPLALTAPAEPGRYFIELVWDGQKPAQRLMLLPITVGGPPAADAPEGIDRQLAGAESIEAEARRIIARWRVIAKQPPLAVDEQADAQARARAAQQEQSSDADVSARAGLGYTAPFTWSKSSNRRDSWERALLDLLGPSVAKNFTADGDVLAVGAAKVGDRQKLVIELLKRR